jgi:hypothetical protein
MSVTRRAVLRGALGAMVGLPALEAFAQARTKRLVLMFNANGTVYPQWAPQAAGQLSPILEPLETFRGQLTVLEHLNCTAGESGPGDGHGKGIGSLWTGTELWGSPIAGDVWWAGGPSVDQVIADQIGTSTALRSLELAVQPQGSRVYDRMIYRAALQPLPPMTDPRAVFDRLFTQAGTDPNLLALRRSRRKSVLDFVGGQLAQVEPEVSAADRLRLDAHLSSVRELEQRLDALPKPLPSCTTPADPAPMVLDDPSQFEAIGRAQMDLLAYALACDLTRVASLQWSSSTSNVVFKWLGCTEDHHSLSHKPDADADSQRQLALIDRWYAMQFAYLLSLLRSLSLLDDTLVVWGNELGKGNVHSHTDVPFVIAGGGVKGGRAIDCTGHAHNDLLLAMMRQMGVQSATFGNPKYCAAPLALG